MKFPIDSKEVIIVDKVLLRRILTDPRLRVRLASDPASVLGTRLTTTEIATIKRVLTQVKSVEEMIATLGDQILCQGGGGCGIARSGHLAG